MKILVLWPPQVPSYFNAGHHLCIFTVGAHLRRTVPQATVRVVDAGALNMTWKAVGDLLVDDPDVVAIVNEFDTVDSFERLVHYSRTLAPLAHIVTFGRLSAVLPEFFTTFDIDGIVPAGDPEVGVDEFVRWIGRGAAGDDVPPALWVRAGEWQRPRAPLPMLAVDDLPLPDVGEIPYAAYDLLYADDTARFCGIPGRRELVVPVARGCPLGCAFCDVGGREGRSERRLPVARVVEFINDAVARLPFEYVSMYAPTFTLNRHWVADFCTAYRAGGPGLPWKCTTTLHHLDEDLLRQMAAAGCVRVSVGLETLDPAGKEHLPRLKRIGRERFDAVASWCAAAGIELNCFVILGLPDTSLDSVQHTVAEVEAAGGRVRPTIYTDYSQMRCDMDVRTIASFNRQLFRPGQEPADADAFYRIMFNPAARRTDVAHRVPAR